MIELAVGLGIVLSLAFAEGYGVAAGGIVVPGYIALNLHYPSRVVATFLAALLVYSIIRFLARWFLIYGRRRLVISLLLGFVFGFLFRNYLGRLPMLAGLDLTSIGYIIPGLIASWMDRQGVWRTLSMLFIAAAIVQMVLMLVEGGRIVV